MLIRAVETQIEDYLSKKEKKILFLWGPRRSGKTTLLEKIAKEHRAPIFNFDLLSDREKFVARRDVLKKLSLEHKLLLIDEVQQYPEATVALKILHDLFDVQIIATGSSELRQKSSEFDSLSGRFVEAYCLPLTTGEVMNNASVRAYETDQFLQKVSDTMQTYGSYPETYLSTDDESRRTELLQNIIDTYVLKDIISIYDLKNTKLAHDILTKIALQLGSECSIREIANSVQANAVTVANYIEIFIKNYILIPLPSFKTNTRRAVSENRKLYFYDLGIRNALVKDFRELHLRPDSGGVFENFIVSEIEKNRRITHANVSIYFYREYGGKEVDLVIEDYQKRYRCIEIKTKETREKNDIFPLPHEHQLIHGQNYFQIISELFPS